MDVQPSHSLSYEERVAIAQAKYSRKLQERFGEVEKAINARISTGVVQAPVGTFTTSTTSFLSSATRDRSTLRDGTAGNVNAASVGESHAERTSNPSTTLSPSHNASTSQLGGIVPTSSIGDIAAQTTSRPIFSNGDKPDTRARGNANENAIVIGESYDSSPDIPLATLSRSSSHNNAQATAIHPPAPISRDAAAPAAAISSNSPVVPSAYVDERRPSTSTGRRQMIIGKSLQRPMQAPADAPRASSSSSNNGASLYSETVPLPDWHSQVRGRLEPADRSRKVQLQKIKSHISRAIEACRAGNQAKYVEELDHIRTQLHDFEYMKEITQLVMKDSGLLTMTSGLPQLFLRRRDGFSFPFDIVADAKALHRKWCRADFDPDIMRGLLSGTGKNRKVNSLDPNYPHRLNGDFIGSGDLVSGQWWPVLIAALRDGAHNASQAGICWGKQGVTSILVAGKYPEDEDNGDEIIYTGTEGTSGDATEATKQLLAVVGKQKPVRVIRSSELTSQYSPEEGYRYDGLYDVVESTLLDRQKSHYKFRLLRCPDQDPIRWTGIGARPTPQDKFAYHTHKRLLG